MKKIIIILVIFILIISTGTIYRYIQLIPANVGTGEIRKSPDGKYQATAYSCQSESFWGHERSWYEFKIEELPKETLIRKLETAPIWGPYFGSRSDHKVVFWDKNSKEVSFKFPGIEIKMNVEENNKK